MQRVKVNIKPYMLGFWLIIIILALLCGLAAKGINPQINSLVAASVALNVLTTLVWLFAALLGRGEIVRPKSRRYETLSPELKGLVEESWQANKAGYQYLADEGKRHDQAQP